MENRMKTHCKKGFTLIEVILSLAIFAIISVGFLGMFSMVFINTYNSTELTEQSFLAQKEVEDEIRNVKSALEQGNTPTGYTTATITVFSGAQERDVQVYKVESGVDSGKVIQSYVAETRPPQLRVPVITSNVIIAAYSGATEVLYPNAAMSNLAMDLKFDLTVDNPGLLIRYVYYWYVSKPGEYIMHQPPVFPDDYMIIPDQTTRRINEITDEYDGRFLTLVVTPVGEKGQMGNSVVSNSVYISAMPVNASLLVHYDLSSVNQTDTTHTRFNTSDGIYYLRKIIDRGSNSIDLNQTNNSLQPILVEDSSIRGYEQYFYGVSATSANRYVFSASNSSANSKNVMTVYVAAKFADGFPSNTAIFYSNFNNSSPTANRSNRWLLRTNDTGQLELRRHNNSSTSFISVVTEAEYRGDQWTIFKFEVNNNLLGIKINQANHFTTSFTSTTNTMNLTPFAIYTNPFLTVGEVLVYDVVHNSETEALIFEYLSQKFQSDE
jgi:prepilin-type N-terminal cleavage/methylation domain-containing protein